MPCFPGLVGQLLTQWSTEATEDNLRDMLWLVMRFMNSMPLGPTGLSTATVLACFDAIGRHAPIEVRLACAALSPVLPSQSLHSCCACAVNISGVLSMRWWWRRRRWRWLRRTGVDSRRYVATP